MAGAYRFDFDQTKTVILVGAGASRALSYELLTGDEGKGICMRALERPLRAENPDKPHVERCRELLECHIGPRYRWDLERICEHLSHIPAFMYDRRPLNCNTEFIRQWIVQEINETMGQVPEQNGLKATKSYWEHLLDLPSPTAIFTTNYDSVIEACLDGKEYVDGWVDDEYRREYFESGKPVDRALVKLHGTAGRKHSWQYITRRVWDGADPVTQRPALIEPSRHKTTDVEPFSSAYDFLERSLTSAERLIILGFSWRDRSVAEAFRRALLRRAGGLEVFVYDRNPFVVDERVRAFFRASGTGGWLPLLLWRYSESDLPDVTLDAAEELKPLYSPVTLDDAGEWAFVKGEPQMLEGPKEGRISVAWEDKPIYFESGRAVLRRSLPARFAIELTMTMRRYGSGWDPGISLEDERGRELFFARFIKEGGVWRHRDEAPESGIRLGKGVSVFRRVPVPEEIPVDVGIVLADDAIRYEIKVGGELAHSDSLGLQTGQRAQRLHLGAYPWYSDPGLAGYGRATQCDIGPCTVTPLT